MGTFFIPLTIYKSVLTLWKGGGGKRKDVNIIEEKVDCISSIEMLSKSILQLYKEYFNKFEIVIS